MRDSQAEGDLVEQQLHHQVLEIELARRADKLVQLEQAKVAARLSDEAARAVSIQQAEALQNSIIANQNLQHLPNQKLMSCHLKKFQAFCGNSRQPVLFNAGDADMHCSKSSKYDIVAFHANL